MSEKRKPGYYWVIIDEGAEPEVAHWDGDDWFPVASEESVEPKTVVSERLVPPSTTQPGERREPPAGGSARDRKWAQTSD
jgi:hypothetical protein